MYSEIENNRPSDVTSLLFQTLRMQTGSSTRLVINLMHPIGHVILTSVGSARRGRAEPEAICQGLVRDHGPHPLNHKYQRTSSLISQLPNPFHL